MNTYTNTKICMSTHILVSISQVYVIQPIRIFVSIPKNKYSNNYSYHIISLNVKVLV